mgnify:CR=1 FL=1
MSPNPHLLSPLGVAVGGRTSRLQASLIQFLEKWKVLYCLLLQ